MDPGAQELGGYVVANDAVGAGVEFVLYASGSSARQTAMTKDRPCDVIMAIVDSWEVGGEQRYVKYPEIGYPDLGSLLASRDTSRMPRWENSMVLAADPDHCSARDSDRP